MKKNKTRRRLALKKTTLATLSGSGLKQVQGGTGITVDCNFGVAPYSERCSAQTCRG